MLEEKAVLREERMRADMLAREELRVRSQAETDERNLSREKLHAEIKAKNKQFKLQANNELQQQKQDAEMKVQLAQMELMESCLLYTSPSPRDRQKSRMPSSA